MPRDTTRRRVLSGGAAAVAAALAGCSSFTPFVGKRQEDERTVPVDGADALVVANELGDVTVRTADRKDVHVEMVKQSSSVTSDLEALTFGVEREGGRLRLKGEWTKDEPLTNKPSLDLTVAVPRSFPVERLDTGAGDVILEDVAGYATDGGTPGVTVRAHTGDVEFRRVRGDASALVSTGDLAFEAVSGTVTGRANTGDLQVRSPDAVGDLRTHTGDVVADVPALAGDTTIGTSTGDVEAAVATDLGAELLATAGIGDVTVTGLSLSNAARSDDRVSGVVGGDGPHLDLRTDTGDVTVSALD